MECHKMKAFNSVFAPLHCAATNYSLKKDSARWLQGNSWTNGTAVSSGS